MPSIANHQSRIDNPLDAHPTLVYMQARHYDPTLGRFLQPDSLPLASMTTQGMNKYIYCENDSVTFSDRTGQFAPAVSFGIAFAIGFNLEGLSAAVVFDGMSSLGFALRGLMSLIFLKTMTRSMGANCDNAFAKQDAMLANLLVQ